MIATEEEVTSRKLPTGYLVARNAGINLSGECLSGLIGVASIPYIIRTLGTESFGILSLAWILLVYFTLFDVGLAKATTKLASEALGRGEETRLPAIIGTTLGFQSGLGVLGGLAMASCVPLLVNRVLKISPSLKAEAAESFWILCALVPVILASNSLRGTLEALQRFDLTNYVKIPTNASMFLLPLVLLRFGFHLPAIVFSMAIFRIGALIAFFLLCLRSLPQASRYFCFELKMGRALFTYGGWVTISNATGPILVYADRFMLGALVSMSAVAFYTAPADMVSRFLVIPTSLAATLFPALSSFGGAGMKLKVEEFYARSLKCTVLLLGPALAVIIGFSGKLLQLWLGTEFAFKTALPLQVMAIGVFINAIGFFPFTLLLGANRPDITGIFHLIELPIQIGLVWVLVLKFGILGASVAWTLRTLLDTALLFFACWRLRIVPRGALTGHGVIRSLNYIFVLFASVWIIGFFVPQRIGQEFLVGLALVAFCVSSWYLVLDSQDRDFLGEIMQRARLISG